MTETEPIKLISTKEACKLWGVSRYHLYELIEKGKLKPIVNVGKGYKWLATDYKEEFLERL